MKFNKTAVLILSLSVFVLSAVGVGRANAIVGSTIRCDYAAPPTGCNYVQGPNYDPTTSCGMILSCPTPAPAITSVIAATQDSGIASLDSGLIISGSNLTDASAVNFYDANDVLRAQITNPDPNSYMGKGIVVSLGGAQAQVVYGALRALTFPSGTSLGNLKIRVVTPAGLSNASPLTSLGAPTITSLAQNTTTADSAASLTIYGTNFWGDAGSVVEFYSAGQKVASITPKFAATRVTSTSIYLDASQDLLFPTVPVGTYQVQVVNTLNGITARSNFANFVMQPSPANTVPTINGVNPSQGTANSVITISGVNLTGANTVSFYNVNNQLVASISNTSATSINNIVVDSTGSSLRLTLAGAFAYNAAGTWQMRVVTPSGTSNALPFTVVAPAASTPTITVLSPASGDVISNGGGKNAIATINWISSPDVGNYPLEIDLLNTSGQIVKYLATNISRTTNSFVWMYDPSLPSGTYKVAVSTQTRDGSVGQAYGTSGLFTVNTVALPQPSITITSPNGGEQITVAGKDVDFRVTWTSFNLSGNATIYLVGTDGRTCFLGKVPVSQGNFPVSLGTNYQCSNISKTITTGQYKILITTDTPNADPNDMRGVYDKSNDYFTITIATVSTLPAPIISSINPTSAKAGDIVAINGTNLVISARTGSVVRIGTTILADTNGGIVGAISNEKLTIKIPSTISAGVYNLNVEQYIPNLDTAGGTTVKSNLVPIEITSGARGIACEYARPPQGYHWEGMKPYPICGGRLVRDIGTETAGGALPSDIDTQKAQGSCVDLQNNLRYRSRDANTNNEVSSFQDFLQTNNYLSLEPTGFFGIMTLKAAKDFQKAVGISPTGFIGQLTRAKIKAMTCSL